MTLIQKINLTMLLTFLIFILMSLSTLTNDILSILPEKSSGSNKNNVSPKNLYIIHNFDPRINEVLENMASFIKVAIPDYQIEFIREGNLAGVEEYTKKFAYDDSIIVMGDIQNLNEIKEKGFLTELNQIIDVSDFFEQFLLKEDDKVYALPLVISFGIILGRQDLLEKENITPPSNLEEVLKVSQLLNKDEDKDGNIDLWGITILPYNLTGESKEEFLNNINLNPQNMFYDIHLVQSSTFYHKTYPNLRNLKIQIGEEGEFPMNSYFIWGTIGYYLQIPEGIPLVVINPYEGKIQMPYESYGIGILNNHPIDGAQEFLKIYFTEDFQKELCNLTDFLPASKKLISSTDFHADEIRKKMAEIAINSIPFTKHISYKVKEFSKIGVPSKVEWETFSLSSQKTTFKITNSCFANDCKPIVLFEKEIDLKAGKNSIVATLPEDEKFYFQGINLLEVSYGNNKENYSYYFSSVSALNEEIKSINELVKAFEEQIKKREKEIGVALKYPRTLMNLNKRLLNQNVKIDMSNRNYHRVKNTLNFIKESSENAIEEVKRTNKNTANFFYFKDQSVFPYRIEDGAFAGKDGKFFLIGGCGWGKVKEDIPNMHSLGMNSIAIEEGPSGTLLDIDKPNVQKVNEIKEVLKRAEKENVSVMLLISPHYFPQWGYKRFPEVESCGAGFLKYCILNPNARKILSAHLKSLIPQIKDMPSLHSYCLANEPNFRERCPYARERLIEYLKRKYAQPPSVIVDKTDLTIDFALGKVNELWKKNYKNWDELRLPPEVIYRNPAMKYDWHDCHYEIGTEFFKFLKDNIRMHGDNHPVHVKFMQDVFAAGWDEASAGIDRERIEEITEISGCDGGWDYPSQSMFYDFLKSLAPDKPIYNTEYHIIGDDTNRFYPTDFIYSIWIEAAIHGQGGANTWVWENESGQSLYNNILWRPEALWGQVKAALDLNRLPDIFYSFAQEIKNTPVAMLYSKSSKINSSSFINKSNALYRQLLFSGFPVRFLTEDRIAKEEIPENVKIIFALDCDFFKETAFKKLTSFKGKIIISKKSFKYDEHGIERKFVPSDNFKIIDEGEENQFQKISELIKSAGVASEFELIRENKSPSKIEWRITTIDKSQKQVDNKKKDKNEKETYIYLLNHSDIEEKIEINKLKGKENKKNKISGIEMLSGKSVNSPFIIKPDTPMIIKVTQ